MNNPYAAPQAEVADLTPTDVGPQEAQRRALIRHEVQLKSVGALYYLGGAMTVLSGLALLGQSFDGSYLALVAVGLLLLGLLYLTLGYGFRRLKSWVRIPGGIITALGLLSFPVGTLIGGWILYLMFGEKGQQVLAPEYQDVIAATPHIKFQRSIGDWIALGIVVLLVVGFAALIALGLSRS
ncbi:MAG: hypothetical protein R3F15_21025 [Lysobacterales bacterium]